MGDQRAGGPPDPGGDAAVAGASERFEGIGWQAGADGDVLLPDASATLRVSLETEVEAGDHIVVLLRVVAADRDDRRAPLVFYGSQMRHLAA